MKKIIKKYSIDEVLTRGVEQILPSKDGLAKLMSEKKITLYQGFDPTAPSLHVGHFIGIRKLAQFQKLGHKVIFLIGDFTGLIGDPTDKSAARKRQTREEVLQNLKDYKKEVERVIDFEGPNAAEIMFNSKWLAKLTFEDLIEISSHLTVQQIIERNIFQERIKNGKPIYLHEFFYPLMQGYDSVVMNVDLEIGGNDQLFNMLTGRSLMKDIKHKDKYVLSMKLLTDTSGKKMGKSEGNAIFLADSAENIFGKVMAWPDSFINLSIELLTDWPLDFAKNKSPLDVKKQIAAEIVTQIYGDKMAEKAEENFENTFQKKDPDYKNEIKKLGGLIATLEQIVGSKSEAKRVIKQGGLDVNNQKVTDLNFELKSGDKIKIGKKIFVKIV